MDAPHLLSLGGIDADNAGVRQRTAQGTPPQHPRQCDIGGVLGGTGHLIVSFDPGRRLADGGVWHPRPLRGLSRTHDEPSGMAARWRLPHTVSGSIRIVRWSRAEAIMASVTCTTRKPSRPLAAGSRSW